MKPYLCVRHETLRHCESKGRLGEVCMLCAAVQHLLFCSVQGSWFQGCAKLYITCPLLLISHIADNLISAQQNGLYTHLGAGRCKYRPIIVYPSRILVVFFLSCAIVGAGKRLKFPSVFVLISRLLRLIRLVTSSDGTAF